MHVGAAQARTRLQIGPRVHRAAHRGRIDPAQHVSTVAQVKCWVRCDQHVTVVSADGLVRARTYN